MVVLILDVASFMVGPMLNVEFRVLLKRTRACQANVDMPTRVEPLMLELRPRRLSLRLAGALSERQRLRRQRLWLCHQGFRDHLLEPRPLLIQPGMAPDLGPFRVTTTGTGAVHPPLSAPGQTARVCTESGRSVQQGQGSGGSAETATL